MTDFSILCCCTIYCFISLQCQLQVGNQKPYNDISSHNGFFYSVLLQFIAYLLAVLDISFNPNYRSDDPTERVWGVAYEVSQVYEK
jgi:hypothetical protein